MKAQELRIGNYVYEDNNLVVDVVNWHFEKASLENTPNNIDVKPIPLTEEWLLRFGFSKYMNEFTIREKTVFHIYKQDKLFVFVLGKTIIIKHVHQLQNLYFALANEELTENEDLEKVIKQGYL